MEFGETRQVLLGKTHRTNSQSKGKQSGEEQEKAKD